MICASCGEEIGTGIRFCPCCGERVPPPAAPGNRAQGDGDIVAVRSTVIKAAGNVYLGGDAAAAQMGAAECVICGKFNRREDSFRCRGCGREYLCLRHQDPDLLVCRDCARPQRDAEETARRVAEERARQVFELQRRQLAIGHGVVMELVRVPAGLFLMGSAPSDKQAHDGEKPQHTVTLGEYCIGKFPVTQAQWAAFVKATGYASSAKLSPGKERHPVTHVTWQDAMTFAGWASQVSGRTVRLPTEAEWEKAARGADGRVYPWGNEAPDAVRCNFHDNVKDTTPVGTYSPLGDSPYGLAYLWERV